MVVEELALQDFRNYERAQVGFPPGLTLVTGRNAQGKTNLLEAVYCLSGIGSPRSADAAVVRDGADAAYLHGRVARGERNLEIDLELRRGKGTRALINKTPVPAAQALRQAAVSVFFGPDDLALVKGGPDGRRRFLDDLSVKLRPARDGSRREWERVLRQRNSLLKTAPRAAQGSAGKTLEVWDEALCRTGATLAAGRLESLARLIPFARDRYEAVSGGDRLRLSYESGWLDMGLVDKALDEPATIEEPALEQCLARAVEGVRTRELERGVSLVGPHRDDMLPALGAAAPGRDVRTHASQGEQRTAALALKLAEYDLLCEALGDTPILLLDDVFSELDPMRREWLSESVRSGGQTIVSSAEMGAEEAAGAERIVEIEAGAIRAQR